MSLIGTDQVEGTDVYKLKVTLASNGDVRTYYLDAESCVPIKYEVKRTVRGAERWFEVELGDYKEVQGVLFPFAVAIGAKGSSSADKQQYAWDRITVNPVLDDRRFTRPARRREGRSGRAATQPAPRARARVDSRTSPSRFRLHGDRRRPRASIRRRPPDSARGTSARPRCRGA